MTGHSNGIERKHPPLHEEGAFWDVKAAVKGLRPFQKVAGTFLLLLVFFILGGMVNRPPYFMLHTSYSDNVAKSAGAIVLAPILFLVARIMPWRWVRYYLYFVAIGLLAHFAAIALGFLI